jgi:hypothetical protein
MSTADHVTCGRCGSCNALCTCDKQDYPNLRAVNWCALCEGEKDVGLVVCWICWRAFNFRNGVHPKVEHVLKLTESTAGTTNRLKKRVSDFGSNWRFMLWRATQKRS